MVWGSCVIASPKHLERRHERTREAGTENILRFALGVGKTVLVEPAQTLREGCVFICTFRCGTSGFYGNNDTHIYRSTASDADPYCCSIRCIHLLLCRSYHHA
jgi:hypothetical protein